MISLFTLLLKANTVSFLLDNSVPLFLLAHVSCKSQAVVLWRNSQAPPDARSYSMDLGVQFALQIFSGIKVMALCKPVSSVHLVLYRGDICFWLLSCWTTKGRPRPSFTVECLKFYFKIFPYHSSDIKYRLYDSFHLKDILSSRCTEGAPQHSTPYTTFQCMDCVLWGVCPSLLSLNKSSISVAKEL